MQERVFKIEVNDEMFDMLEIRIQDKREIEIFSLTQALGLFELLERKVILTSQCKKSVFAHSFQKALMEINADTDVVNVITRAAELQGDILEVTEEVVKEAKQLRKEALKLLKKRLSVEQEKKREWYEMYNYDVKTLRRMHDEAKAKRDAEIAEMVRQKEMWTGLNNAIERGNKK